MDWDWTLIDATWPAAATAECGAFRLRRGAGGGRRVSAASVDQGKEPVDLVASDIEAAERGMAAWGQTPIFQVRDGQDVLDQSLDRAGYSAHDATLCMIGHLEPHRPALPIVESPAPLSIQRCIWQSGGIGAARLAIMERVAGPKTYLLGRIGDRAAGVAIAAVYGSTAMVHAVEVSPAFRRQGLANAIMAGTCRWAVDHGATQLGVLVTRDNAAAIALYSGLGLRPVAAYHYRSCTNKDAA